MYGALTLKGLDVEALTAISLRTCKPSRSGASGELALRDAGGVSTGT